MAVYPTDKGSPGTWGAECSAYHAVSTDLATGKIKNEALQVADTAPIADAALANKKYVDDDFKGVGDSAATLSQVPIRTAYILGTLTASGTTTVSLPAGLSYTGVLSVTAIVEQADVNIFRSPGYGEGSQTNFRWDLQLSAGSIKFLNVGSSMQSGRYRITLKYL